MQRSKVETCSAKLATYQSVYDAIVAVAVIRCFEVYQATKCLPVVRLVVEEVLSDIQIKIDSTVVLEKLIFNAVQAFQNRLLQERVRS
jgi:hypothetical protein